ncbi:hypothetical protein PR048_015408 [Dryococelus australis]|uniref:Uncharacterized protein n=1 Tax=Dryococelus australis TaxID=614101 RepID=A0ABQ9HGZ2_9NEOP|nr:hypothetical protein PR048_015408 [Dryococelus australis]
MGDKLNNLLLAVCALENEDNAALMTAIMLLMRGHYHHVALSSLRNTHMVHIQRISEEWVTAYCDDDFRTHFKLTRQSLDELMAVLSTEHNTVGRYGGGNVSISMTKKLYITLWYLAKEDSLKKIAEHFGVVKSTVKEAVDELTRGIASLASRYILWPTAEECAVVEEKFRREGGLPGRAMC